MTYQLEHKGLVREFDFYPPIGWPYWRQRVEEETGRQGLPLIVALHGGGQNPLDFTANWPFANLFSGPDNANWEDRCLVLYPWGFAPASLALTREPVRGWNMGFASGFPVETGDVGFIKKMIDTVEELLQRELRTLGIEGPAIDPDRRFLFGYSAGGMMAYRLANRMPNHWAALWVQSAAYGGRAADGITARVTNQPTGRHAVSLFAHHGEADVVVPPGPFNDPVGLVPSEFATDVYEAVGLTTPEAEEYTTSYRHLAAAVKAYRLHNNCKEDPFESLTTEPDVGGGSASRKATWRQAGDPPNPEVVAYRDPDMDHTNFVPNRYFDIDDVWDFFKTHPRVRL